MKNIKLILVVAITFVIENLETLLSYILHIEMKKSYTVVGTQLTGSFIVYEQMHMTEKDAILFVDAKQKNYKWKPITNPVTDYNIFSLIPNKVGHFTATKIKTIITENKK